MLFRVVLPNPGRLRSAAIKLSHLRISRHRNALWRSVFRDEDFRFRKPVPSCSRSMSQVLPQAVEPLMSKHIANGRPIWLSAVSGVQPKWSRKPAPASLFASWPLWMPYFSFFLGWPQACYFSTESTRSSRSSIRELLHARHANGPALDSSHGSFSPNTTPGSTGPRRPRKRPPSRCITYFIFSSSRPSSRALSMSAARHSCLRRQPLLRTPAYHVDQCMTLSTKRGIMAV